MDYEEPTLASLVFGLFREIFNWIGSDFGGDATLGFVLIVAVIVMFTAKGIVAWVAAGFIVLTTLSAMMSKGEPLGEALAWFFFAGGLFVAVINNLIAIITGKYWKIKTNLIMGGVYVVLGVIISCIMS